MKRIAVIDDESIILEVVGLVLELEGFQVHTSQSGRYLQQLQHTFPDLIILDVCLKGEDGRDICQKLKTNTDTQHIPVILFSAVLTAHEALEASCADDFLSKPFHIRDLLNLVQKYL